MQFLTWNFQNPECLLKERAGHLTIASANIIFENRGKLAPVYSTENIFTQNMVLLHNNEVKNQKRTTTQPHLQRTIYSDPNEQNFDLESMTLESVLPVEKTYTPVAYQSSIRSRLGPQVQVQKNNAAGIHELFSGMGELESVKMDLPGSAVVCFDQVSDALRAVNAYHNRSLDGQPMQCRLLSSRYA
ncbi:polymerase delta-interacting protein 3 [Nymphon striatum]|nr:polymerase delta-interacting protein 3 [Nymphon striatum]